MKSVTARRRRQLIAPGLLRALRTEVVVVVLYYVLPLDRLSDTNLLARIVIGVALLAGMIAWQVGTSSAPTIRPFGRSSPPPHHSPVPGPGVSKRFGTRLCRAISGPLGTAKASRLRCLAGRLRSLETRLEAP